MEYLRPYSFVFDSPRWFLNLLLELVCQMIPIVGPIVALGYRYEIIQELHTSGGKRYPDFDFNRFMPYLTRGLWPLIVQIIISMPLALLLVLLYFVTFGVVIAVVDKSNASIVIPIGFGVVFLVVIAASVAMGVLLIPAALWAGLAQDFKPAAIWEFVKEYIHLVLWDTVIALVINSLLGVAVVMVGLLTCVGYPFAIVLFVMAQTHIIWQLYELYLERGGTEVPLKLDGE